MSLYEDLSRLLAGELPPDHAAALQARIEADPDVRAAWDELRHLPIQVALPAAVPPDLDAAVLARSQRSRRRWVPWAVSAAAVGLLVVALSHEPEPTRLSISRGTVQVDGHAVAAIGEATVEVDGRATIRVEPDGDARRVTEVEGPMKLGTKTFLAGTGLVVTLVVTEGTATVHAANGPRRASAGSHPPATEAGTTTCRELEQENALLRQLLADQEVEMHGTPIPWPTDLLEAFTPTGYERRVRSARAACAPQTELVGFECSEPPCFALFRSPPASFWDDFVNACPEWVELYTSAVASASGQATCPDGHREQYLLLGWPLALADGDRPIGDEEKENRSKRFRSRVDEIVRDWKCR